MKLLESNARTLALATALLSLPLFPAAASSQSVNDASSGQSEAMQMVPVNAVLVRPLDAKTNAPGSQFQARLSQTIHLKDGTKLPSGTTLTGTVVQDTTQQPGASKLALRFTQAQLKGGKSIPIKATIVGVAAPESAAGNNWSTSTLQIDQTGALRNIDLHSNITNQDSGVLVSKKDDVKLSIGTEFQLAVAAQPKGQAAAGD